MMNHEMLKAGRVHVEAIMGNDSADTFEDALVEECMTYTDYAEVFAYLTDFFGSAAVDEQITAVLGQMLREYCDMTI